MEENLLDKKLYMSEQQLNGQRSLKRGGSHKHLSTKSSYHEGSLWVSRSLQTISKSAGDLLRQSSADLLSVQIDAFTPVHKAHPVIERKPCRSGYYDVPDQGYAWVVLMSTAICNMLAAVSLFASGLFYTMLIEEFGSPVTLSWIISVQASLYMALGPLAAFIVKKTNARISTMMGLAGLALSFLISSQVTSVVSLFIFFGVAAGFSGSLVFLPCNIYARKYFLKRTTLALAIPTLGVPLVMLIMVPIIKEIMIEYGWRNAAVFIAAIYVQCLVPAMLLREPRFCPEDDKVMIASRATLARSQSLLHNSRRNNIDFASQPSVNQDHTLGLQQSAVTVYDAYNLTKETQETDYVNQNGWTKHAGEDKSDHKLDTVEEGLVWTANGKHDKNHVAIDEQNEILSSDSNLHSSISDSQSTSYCSALRNVGFIIFVFSYFLWGVGTSIFYLLLPDFLKERGVIERSVSNIYIAMGVGALVSRSAVCFISATIEYNKLGLAAISFFTQAASNIGLVMLNRFMSYIIFSTISSISYSVMGALPGAIIHLLIKDKQDMDLAYGLAHLAFGAAVLLAPPFSAMLLKLLGSYDPAMFLGSGFLFMAAVFYFIISIRIHLKTKNKKPVETVL